MFFSKYIKIMFITLVLIFISINIPIVYAQDNTTEVQKESIESIDKSKTTETSKEETEEDESDENDSEHKHEHGHVNTDLTGENAEFGREEHHHDHEHDECEYFHKAWREPGTIDIMKKYSLILFSLFGIIVIYRLISKRN